MRRRFFLGEDVIALEIDPGRLDRTQLRDEDLYGHGAHPHYYGEIPADAIRGARRFGVLDSVARAESVVRRFFPPTPLLEARRLSRRLGRPILLKLDAVTPIRTFKLRGALTKLESLESAGVRGGVATASAGNHGLAVAWAARAYGRPSVVVVPVSANPQKAEAIAALGAEVIHHGSDYQSAADHAAAVAAERGLVTVHAYDDPDVITGQGTLALELPAETDALILGIGGGGLIAGAGMVLKTRSPATTVIGVQPEGADSMARSLEAGRVTGLERVTTCADGLGARAPSARTFELTRRFVDRVVRVSDEAMVRAIGVLLEEERIVAEPAGIAGLAALIADPSIVPADRGRLVVGITGANISDGLFREVLESS